eukprot:9477771-Pyramimonas_sp.AAC.1
MAPMSARIIGAQRDQCPWGSCICMEFGPARMPPGALATSDWPLRHASYCDPRAGSGPIVNRTLKEDASITHCRHV